MNCNYLRHIKEGKSTEPRYIIKQLETVEGARDHNGIQQIRTHSSYYISYPENLNDYFYQDYLLEFKEYLDLRNHIFSEGILHILTLFFLRIRDKSISTERAWSIFSQGINTKCDLHLEYPIIGMTSDLNEQLHLQDYDIGNFDVVSFRDKLISLPKTNYWDIFKKENDYSIDELKKFLSFGRSYSKITIIDYLFLYIKKLVSQDETLILTDLYFEALTIKFFKIFWTELDDQLIDSLALGGAYYSHKIFQYVTVGRCTQVSIFSNIEKYPQNGWVIPLTHGSMSLHFDSQKRIPDLNKDLSQYYESIENNKSIFLHPIKFLIHHLGNGLKLLQDEKVNEAFINFWLSLESILKTDDARSFKNRVAAITWSKFNTTHQSQFDLVNIFYKSRNFYIHSGVYIDRNLCLKLRDNAQAILEILIKMHLRNDKQIENYKKRLVIRY